MKTNKVILMPVDFGEQALLAVDYAAYFAEKDESSILLLTVIEESSWLAKFMSAEKHEEIKMAAEAELKNMATKLSAKYTAVKFEIRIEFGKAYVQILKVADEILPEFIMVGKTEKPNLAQLVLGSNTQHLIHESKYPVLSIRGSVNLQEVASGEMNFVVPLDVTKEVNDQLTAAVEYGKLFDARIDLFTVLNKNSAALEIKALTKLHQAKEIMDAEGLKSTEKMVKQIDRSVSEMIIDYADEIKAELIIILTQQNISTVNYFLGTTAKALLQTSDIPVMSVLPWDDTKDTVFNFFVDPLGVL